MTPAPEIFIMIPPPLYISDAPLHISDVFKMNQTVIKEIYPTLIREIAKQTNIADDHIVDLFEIMGGSKLNMGDLFADGCHPTTAGYKVLAKAVLDQMNLK